MEAALASGGATVNNPPAMKSFLTLLLLAAAITAPAADQPAPAQSLFNGRDLTGWTNVNKSVFAVTNGNLLLVTGMGWLRTEQEYGDFTLELEYRPLVANYDSGVFIRCGAEGQPWPKDGWQVNLRADALGALVRGYKTMVPAETPKLPVNQWVKLRLECLGKKITLDVNGERAWEFDQLDRDRGYIGFQAEDKSFEFRNLLLTELKAKVPQPAK
jgi:hypothetical protein